MLVQYRKYRETIGNVDHWLDRFVSLLRLKIGPLFKIFWLFWSNVFPRCILSKFKMLYTYVLKIFLCTYWYYSLKLLNYYYRPEKRNEAIQSVIYNPNSFPIIPALYQHLQPTYVQSNFPYLRYLTLYLTNRASINKFKMFYHCVLKIFLCTYC